jgi:hypothetical protein
MRSWKWSLQDPLGRRWLLHHLHPESQGETPKGIGGIGTEPAKAYDGHFEEVGKIEESGYTEAPTGSKRIQKGEMRWKCGNALIFDLIYLWLIGLSVISKLVKMFPPNCFSWLTGSRVEGYLLKECSSKRLDRHGQISANFICSTVMWLGG